MTIAKWILTIAAAIGMTFNVACSRPNSSPKDVPSSNKDKGGTPGTGDGGGGNTCNGRPIESYAYNIQSTKAFQEHLLPIYAELEKRNDDLFRLFKFVISNKSWFLIPCELTKLPDDKIGSAVRTEQAAIQTFNEVWNYKPLIEKMDARDEALLYWHEIFMGIKLLKLESFFNQCKAFAPDFSLCDGAGQKRQGKPSNLTADDYADVRKAAADIMTMSHPLSQEDWNDFLGQRNFSFGIRSFERKSIKEPIGFSETVERLRKARILGYWPKIGHSTTNEDGSAVAVENCSVDFTVQGEDRILVTLNQGHGNEIREVVSVGNTHLIQREHLGKKSKQIVLGSPNMAALRLSDRHYGINLYFDNSDSLFAVTFLERVCHTSYPDTTCASATSPAKAKLYVCGLERIKDDELR